MTMLLVPTVFTQVDAQVVETQGENYDLIENFNIGEASWQSHPDRIMINGQWENYFLETDEQKIIFKSNSIGGLIYDVPSCSYSLYENGYNSNQVIPSVSFVGTQNNNGTWENLSVNGESCLVSFTENNDGITITSIKENTTQKLQQELIIDIKSGVKETFKLWDQSNNELGISQTVHTDESIIVGETVIPIVQYSGQSFDRNFIIDNRAQILQLTDKISYDFDKGINFLSNVNIIFDETSIIPYKVNLDYANGNFTNYLEIDPTFGYATGTKILAFQTGAYGSSGCSGTGNSVGFGSTLTLYMENIYNSGVSCGNTAVEYDISSIPDTAVISDVDIRYDIDVYQLIGACDWNALTVTQPSTYTNTPSNALTLFQQIDTGSTYVNADSGCASTGIDKLVDLGSNADTDLQSQLSSDWFAVGIDADSWVRTYGNWEWQKQDEADIELLVTYALPLPNAPTGLSITTQNTANQLTLTWLAPSSGDTPDGYKIGRSVDGGAWNDSYVTDTGSTAVTYDDTGLSPDTNYAYRAWSLIGTTASTSYDSVAGTTTWNVPDQVGTVTGTSGTNPSLSWSAPLSDGVLTNYKIYRGGVLHDTISSSGTTYSDSTSVVSGSTYAYTVSAVSAVGEGAQSASVNVVAGVPPNPPTGISASIPDTATAPLDVTVSFSPSATTGTGTVTGFQLLRDGVAVATDGLVTSLSDTAPAGGTTYAYTVITLGTHGNSVASASSSVTTPNTPAQVANLALTPVSTSRIDLSWDTPSANNSLISGYKVQISSNGGSSYSDVLTGNVNTVYQALSLSGNAQYHFKVSAINGVGTGTASAVSNTYTMTPTPATLTATAVSEVQINLAWGASTGATGYKIEYESPTGNGFTTHTSDTGDTNLTASISGLTTATQYNFRVSGLNAGGASVASPEASSYTWGVLQAPVIDTITRLSPTSLKLDFTTGVGLPVATGYLIERQTGSGWIELIADTGNTDVTYTDNVLSSDQSATYRIYAINSIGMSPVSNEKASDAVASSGGGGGSSSSKAVSSQTGVSGLVDLTFIDQIHRVVLGQFLSKSINVAWDTSDNLEVKSIIVSDSPFRIVFQDVPFVLLGDPSGISNGKINYSVQIPNELCTTQGQVNCVEQKQYDIPVEIKTDYKGTTLTKSSVIKIDLAGGSDIPLVFVLLAIGAVPLAFIIRKVGSGKKKRKASGSSHKSSKNGSNSKKVSL